MKVVDLVHRCRGHSACRCGKNVRKKSLAFPRSPGVVFGQERCTEAQITFAGERVMNKKTQITMASCLLSGSAILIGAIIYLASVFPKTEELWKEQERRLSATEMLIVNVSNICKTCGFILIPTLLLTIIGCATWAVFAARRNRQESANQGMEHTR